MNPYENYVIKIEDAHWAAPRDKIYLYETFHESENGAIMLRAEAVDLLGRKGNTTVAVKTAKGW